LGLSVGLEALAAAVMVAALALGPPLIVPRVERLQVQLLDFPTFAPPHLPRPARERAKAPLAPPLRRPRVQPAPLALRRPVASRGKPHVLIVRRLAPGALPEAPARPVDPAPSARPAPPPTELAPDAVLRPGVDGDPQGLPPLPGIAVPAPLLGSFGAARADPPLDPKPEGKIAGTVFSGAGAGATALVSGAIRGAGFGASGSAPAVVARPGSIVHPEGFAATSAPPPMTLAAPPPPAGLEPPRILALPTPAYTPAAARHRIEGDVVMQVRLGADGNVHMLKVTRRLGYGLDRSAVAAARGLRFRPARFHGRPIDWTVILHVHFRLAY
jgi:TonB family protein